MPHILEVCFSSYGQLDANKSNIVLLDLNAKHLYVNELSCPAKHNSYIKEVGKWVKHLLLELSQLMVLIV